MEERRRVIMANLEQRIKTSAEREALARNMLRKELVEKADTGDIEGIKELLTMIGEEAVKSNSKPRASVEVRNDLGQSLLSIAAQHDHVALAEFLLTYWKTVDADRWDLSEGEISVEAKVFKANPNSRDLKGWTCVCIAVFHDSRKVLKLLLEHGGDPNIRSSYNRNAWDLAKDELDAAEKVVKSHAEIRQVLIDNDRSNSNGGPALFSKGEVVKSGDAALYEGLEKDGTAMVMNIEMNKELTADATKAKKEGGKGKGSAAAGGGNGGKGKSGGGAAAAGGGKGKGGKK
jgi:ankyrin repeat protein